MQIIQKTMIKDPRTGKPLGWIEEDREGNQQIRNFYGRLVAYYDKKMNLTTDFYRRPVSYGNSAVGLLYKNS